MIPFADAVDLSGFAADVRKRLDKSLISPILADLHKRGYAAVVSNSLADLERFRMANRHHEDCRSPNTAFDLKFHHDEKAAQCIFLECRGELVGVVARRIIPLRIPGKTLSLTEFIEGLYLFYNDPMDAPRRENCIVNYPGMLRAIHGGSICYGGFAWHDPEHRDLGLFSHVAMLSLILCIASAEQWDWFIAGTHDLKLAIAAFPHPNFTRHLEHNGKPFWLCAASYDDAVAIALKEAE